MPRKKISTTVYITPEQNDRLKVLHDLVLEKYRGTMPGQLTLDDAAPGRRRE
jgi:hypothetical protein